MFDIFDMQPNPLKTYVANQAPRTDQEWAVLFGVSRSHFNMLRNGTAQPSKGVMVRMAEKTSGGVPVAAWFAQSGDVPGKAASSKQSTPSGAV